ncbi:hypothetical protein WR25_09329 [Diploscapter pachys]|uniref:Uncharacterized protein n=1 Tax=Diploscapter pachys TaxID=2018661 RepID=A0A2A2L5B7_9BILA|nr:hypothetical protein WR25_09329 [Diploscapter pachys]
MAIARMAEARSQIASTSGTNEKAVLPAEQTTNFKRSGSFKAFIYRSLRLSKRKKDPNRESLRAQEVENVIIENPNDENEEDSIFLISQAFTRNLTIIRRRREERVFPSQWHDINAQQQVCPLVNFFKKEGKVYDRNCRLTSFERKRRAHECFSVDHHAKEQLFCPEQASQIELQFISLCQRELILRVHAPNGEASNFLYPTRDAPVIFNPTRVGCGHGTWTVEMAVRMGCRFKHVITEEFVLKGQGMLLFHIDPDIRLRLVEKLWLDTLN